MAKPELGTKRLCSGCSAKFYDLNHTPIVCPKCGTIYEIAPPPRGRAEARAETPEEATTDAEKPEFVSLEEADAEAKTGKTGKTKAGDIDEDDIDIEDDVEDDDSTFIPEEEEDDEDVTDIIGDVDTDEET